MLTDMYNTLTPLLKKVACLTVTLVVLVSVLVALAGLRVLWTVGACCCYRLYSSSETTKDGCETAGTVRQASKI